MIYSAQKSNIVMDSVVLGETDSPFLQQASFITNGIYFKTADKLVLPELFMTHYIIEPSCRSLFKTPKLVTVIVYQSLNV